MAPTSPDLARVHSASRLRGDRLPQQVGAHKRSEINKSWRRLAISAYLRQDRQGETRLADIAGSGKRDESCGLQHSEHLTTLELTPDEAAQLGRQEVR